MKMNLKRILLALAVLSLALPTASAIAEPDRDSGRQEHRQQYERQRPERRDNARRDYERRGHEQWRDRDHRFVYREPFVAPYCYTQGGHWTWDGWQHVWVPPETVCR